MTMTPMRQIGPSIMRLIGVDLAETEQVYAETLQAHRGTLSEFLDHLPNYQGKRLRPILLLLTAKACGQVRECHAKLAAAVEMIHTATLVHDDVLDEAAMRRHVETFNARWGNRVSILLGDLLFSNAFRLTSTTGDAEACRLIGEATDRVCAGEMRQVASQGNLYLSEEAYLAIVGGKTAALTECCCRLGAMYSGASPATVNAMAEYGRTLGMAFQIADDVLDLVGSERKTGKTLGTDLIQGKLTLPLIRLLAALPEAKAKGLRSGLLDPKGRDRLLGLLTETGAAESARRTAEEYATCAEKALTCLDGSPARDLLARLPGWGVCRES